MRSTRDLKIFAGTSNPKLAGAITESMGVPLSKTDVGRFSDGEI
ncbi:MAG: ribose-phosphate pyrophosphokinase-like domain-containing protein, partial [Myxococcales bacterium]